MQTRVPGRRIMSSCRATNAKSKPPWVRCEGLRSLRDAAPGGGAAEERCVLSARERRRCSRADVRALLVGSALDRWPRRECEAGCAVTYESFIARKSAVMSFDGIEPDDLPSHLFPHQRDLVSWALRKGRAALFADTGLGKGPMLLEWARQVSRFGRVLILAPLAVGQQLDREAAKFGVDAHYVRDDDAKHRITITNYEMLSHFDAASFVGVALDESSILKSLTGRTRTALIDAFAATPYRLACTATPAPNDFTEFGNHSQFLGVKTHAEMLAEYFVHDMDQTQDWRIKGHAEGPFWTWVASWGALLKRPSDLGHDDGLYALPPLRMHEHVINVEHADAHAAGFLFAPDVRTLSDQRATRRATLDKRAKMAARLAQGDDPVVIWCELNDEGDALEAAIPGAVQVKGANSIEEKTSRIVGFADGLHRVLITKPSVAGFGLNWQHCARVVFMGASHSYEQTYQAIRRCWRFGQTQPVDVHVLRAETEGAVIANYRRKEADAARMAEQMALRTRDVLRAEVHGHSRREWNSYEPTARMVVPTWLEGEAA
ncbi:MAG: DEAD/DEAH box helicase [Deltaproteobacteria bacterium]|nr:DEAD/DEAH box helicase [Deltaproteobacteria bacterium]